MQPSQRGLPGTHARVPAKRVKVQNAPARRVLGNETNRVGRSSPVDATQRNVMHELVSLDARRRQEVESEGRKAQAEQALRAQEREDALRAERKLAAANRAPEPVWRGYNDYEVELLRAEHEQTQRALQADIDRQREEIRVLKHARDEHETAYDAMASANTALTEHVASLEMQLATYDERAHALHADVEATKARNSQLERDLQAAETLRRKLHNQIQELRGNVRVYVRVRPPRADGAQALIKFPDAMLKTQIEVASHAESATGAPTTRQHAFAFDHVFSPAATQEDVFAQVSDLMQSVLDGYNTTIFAYGQTGSGKTHTLEGGADAQWAAHALCASAGLIPRAMHMLWDVAARLQAQGWTYEFEAQMLQIYLDHIYDLLGTPASDKEKHEVRHTDAHTTVTNTVTVPLSGPHEVFSLLERAKKRRQVASTLMNERSSRSHSVFMLRVRGRNATTNETSDATLNLVDLAYVARLTQWLGAPCDERLGQRPDAPERGAEHQQVAEQPRRRDQRARRRPGETRALPQLGADVAAEEQPGGQCQDVRGRAH